MSEKRYFVPEGMLKAAVQTVLGCGLYIQGHEEMQRHALESALKWLAENPIVPSDLEAANMIGGNTTSANSVHCKRGAVEWQRRMFLAPEPPPIREYVRRMFQGWTVTHAEADYIVEELCRVSHGWSRYRDPNRFDWHDKIPPISKQQISEFMEDDFERDCKDLLVMCDEPPHDVEPEDHDAHVREAYERGKKAK